MPRSFELQEDLRESGVDHRLPDSDIVISAHICFTPNRIGGICGGIEHIIGWLVHRSDCGYGLLAIRRLLAFDAIPRTPLSLMPIAVATCAGDNPLSRSRKASCVRGVMVAPAQFLE